MSNSPALGPIEDFIMKASLLLCTIFLIIGAVFYSKPDPKEKDTGKTMFYLASGFCGCILLIILISRMSQPKNNMNSMGGTRANAAQ